MLSLAISLLGLWIPVFAQTAAQKELAAEPEIQKISAASQDFQQQQSIPKNRLESPSPGQTLISGYVGVKGSQILLKQLHDRLEAKAEACSFCPRWQDELAELMREQVASQVASDSIFKLAHDLSGSSTEGLGALFGVDGSGTHWQDKNVAIQEMRAFNREYCPKPGRPSTSQSAEAISCPHVSDNELQDVAELHKTNWSKCFNDHDWVARDGERSAYEKCMKTSDFVTQMCENSGRQHESTCVRLESVDIEDVVPLRTYKPPPNADNTVWTVDSFNSQQIHATLLDAIVVPPPQKQDPRFDIGLFTQVRVRLDDGIQGVAAEHGGGNVYLVAPGSEATVIVQLEPEDGVRNNAILALKLDSVPVNGTMKGIKTLDLTRRIQGWPKTGATLVEKDVSVTFETDCICEYRISKTNFLALGKVPASASASVQSTGAGKKGSTSSATPAIFGNGSAQQASDATGFTKRAGGAQPSPQTALKFIDQGTGFNLDLLDPIDLNSIRQGTLFHAKLLAETPPSANRQANTYVLAAGTDFYLKGELRNNPPWGEAVSIEVDHIVASGQTQKVNVNPLTRVVPHTGVTRTSFHAPMPGTATETPQASSDATSPNQVIFDAHAPLRLIVIMRAPMMSPP